MQQTCHSPYLSWTLYSILHCWLCPPYISLPHSFLTILLIPLVHLGSIFGPFPALLFLSPSFKYPLLPASSLPLYIKYSFLIWGPLKLCICLCDFYHVHFSVETVQSFNHMIEGWGAVRVVSGVSLIGALILSEGLHLHDLITYQRPLLLTASPWRIGSQHEFGAGGVVAQIFSLELWPLGNTN